MVEFFIFLIYFVLCFFTYWAFSKAEIKRLGLSSGALIGLVYFLAMPMFFILLEGGLYEPGIMVEEYDPFEHYWTTVNIFIGWVVVIVAQVVERRSTINTLQSPFALRPLSPKVVVYVLLLFYVIISIYTGFSSGAFDEGVHWHDPARFDSTSFIILKNFANCYRVAFFGGVLFLFEKKLISLKMALLMGFGLALFDIFISFNRITAVYFIIMCFLIFRRWWVWFFLGVLCFVPVVIRVSGVWTWFRGVASLNGYSVEGFFQAWKDVSSSYEASGESFVVEMNSIFESSNILVFHGLVQRVGDSIPVFYGKTYIVRPLTTFVPSTIWPDKPSVFGTYLGRLINSVDGLTLNSTLFGEAFGNFLYFWPFFLLVTLIGFSWLFRRFDSVMPGLSMMSVFIGISLWRFDMNFAVASIYSLFIVGVSVRYLFGRRFLV